MSENKEKTKQRKAEYFQKNKAKITAQQRAYRRKNKEYFAKYQSLYRKKNPEYWRSLVKRRRAMLNNVISEPYTVEQVLELYGKDCNICGLPIDLKAPRKIGQEGWRHALHIDHLIPLSKGGNDTLDNVRPVHGECNLRKHIK